jgi:hypothetical protein
MMCLKTQRLLWGLLGTPSEHVGLREALRSWCSEWAAFPCWSLAFLELDLTIGGWFCSASLPGARYGWSW